MNTLRLFRRSALLAVGFGTLVVSTTPVLAAQDSTVCPQPRIRSHLGDYDYETPEKQPSEYANAFKIIDA